MALLMTATTLPSTHKLPRPMKHLLPFAKVPAYANALVLVRTYLPGLPASTPLPFLPTATACRPGVSSASSPAFTPDGSTLVFLSHQAAVETGTHLATAALCSLPWPQVTGLGGAAFGFGLGGCCMYLKTV